MATVDDVLRQFKKYTVVEFTTSQTWIPPKGATRIDVFLCDGGYGGDGGRGGAGGSNLPGTQGGNGGRGGKCKMLWNVDIHQATSLTVTVGGGGAGGIGGSPTAKSNPNDANNSNTPGGESKLTLNGVPYLVDFNIEERFGAQPTVSDYDDNMGTWPAKAASYNFVSNYMANDGDGKGFTACPLNGKKYCPSGSSGGTSGNSGGGSGGSGKSNPIAGGKSGDGGKGGTKSSVGYATDGTNGTALTAPTAANNLYGAGGNGGGGGGSGITEVTYQSGAGGNGSKGNPGIVVIGYWSA